MRIQDVSITLTQLAQDGHIDSFDATVKPLMASARKSDGTILLTFKEIMDFYVSIYCE